MKKNCCNNCSSCPPKLESVRMLEAMHRVIILNSYQNFISFHLLWMVFFFTYDSWKLYLECRANVISISYSCRNSILSVVSYYNFSKITYVVVLYLYMQWQSQKLFSMETKPNIYYFGGFNFLNINVYDFIFEKSNATDINYFITFLQTVDVAQHLPSNYW